MKLYGREWSRRELEARIGRLEQIGGVQRMRGAEGPEADVEQICVRTGSGLAYRVMPSRGLDISLAEFAGVPISWQSPNGETHPSYYDDEGIEWLRSAVGGLLMTCGLTQVGSPCDDAGRKLGLHGRVHHIPARQVSAEGRWNGDEYEISVRGVVEETQIFGDCLRLIREIRSTLGTNSIQIADVVENSGFEPAPHMLLYHFNFGFPLMSEGTTVDFLGMRAVPRETETPLDGYASWQAPEMGFRERVYYHEPVGAPSPGLNRVTIQNPRFPLGGGPDCDSRSLVVQLSWDRGTLPQLVQWRMPGCGVHVLGIEPANCRVGGRTAERKQGTLLMLAPGESRRYSLELRVDVQNERTISSTDLADN